MATTANPTLTKIDTARVASVQSNSVVSRGSALRGVNPRNIWSLESGVVTGNVSSTIDKFMEVIPQDFGWKNGIKNPVRKSGIRASRWKRFYMEKPTKRPRIYRYDYSDIYSSRFRERNWRDLVYDLLMSEVDTRSNNNTIYFSRSKRARRRTEKRLAKKYGITLRQLRKEKGVVRKVEWRGPDYLMRSQDEKTVPLTGRDVAEIFAWRTGRHNPDSFSQWAGEVWARRAMGKERLSLEEGFDSMSFVGAAEFFNHFAEKMTGKPAPSVEDEMVKADDIGMEYTPQLIYLLRDIEYYTSNDLPTPAVAVMAYLARYYGNMQQQVDNAYDVYEGMHKYLEGDSGEAKLHLEDVQERLRTAENDETDVLLALHERLIR